MKALCRNAIVPSRYHAVELDREIRAARQVHHALLDFEFEHQAIIDAASEAAAPSILRVGRLVKKLARRERRRKRSTGWSPPLHTAWLADLRNRLSQLRAVRNRDPAYKAALAWDREVDPNGAVKECRRKSGESDEDFAKRKALGKRRNRRETWRVQEVYPHRECHWSTYNQLCRAVDQARSDVISVRASGLPADIRRPRYSDPFTLHFEPGSWRIVKRGVVFYHKRKSSYTSRDWWIVELCTHEGRVRVMAKCGNWRNAAQLSDSAFKTAKLTRSRVGRGWKYTLSLCVDVADEQFPGTGVVALDWGHREHGHPEAPDGIRAWTWLGDDGDHGVVVLPKKMRELLDKKHEMDSYVGAMWHARRKAHGILTRSRMKYQLQILREGAPTQEEMAWLNWHQRYERKLESLRKQTFALRDEVYRTTLRMLRQKYAVIVTEDEPGRRHQKLDTEEQTRHRKRQNRDVVARYKFLSMCENSGAEVLKVPSKDTTRECPDCGAFDENTAELYMVCHRCGTARDKDHGAARVILRRGQTVLANRSASTQNQDGAAE